MLKMVVLSPPSPRLTKVYAQGWRGLKTRDPPSIGHSVRFVFEMAWFTPPPEEDLVNI
jgi:hypothetical protein